MVSPPLPMMAPATIDGTSTLKWYVGSTAANEMTCQTSYNLFEILCCENACVTIQFTLIDLDVALLFLAYSIQPRARPSETAIS